MWINLPSFKDLVLHVENSPLMKDSLKTLQLQDSTCWLAYYAGATPKSLIRHVPHRWFSIFVMLERMVELKPFLRRLCNETNHHDWFPTEGDWNAAVWLLETLSPLKNLSDKLEMCHAVTISLVSLPCMIEPGYTFCPCDHGGVG